MPHSKTIIEVPCAEIHIGPRYRKDLGDLESLAQSIAELGLLQPIGITDRRLLVFGARRLLAVRDHLKWETIPARVVDLERIIDAEFAENEARKDFTLSERDAIRRAIESQIPKRRGGSNPDNCPELKGQETREISAQKAGFSSYKSAERVAKVVDHGTPELVDAMDRKVVSIDAAAVIADQPPERQLAILREPAEQRRAIIRAIREGTDLPPGVPLPSPEMARDIAGEVGGAVLDNTHHYRTSASDTECQRVIDVGVLMEAVVTLADTSFDAAELAARLEYWQCPNDLRNKVAAAIQWLSVFKEGIHRNVQVP